MLKASVHYGKHRLWTYIYSRKAKPLPLNHIYVSFTFDTEEDFDDTKPSLYYNSYNYITSGIFYRLVDGLYQRNVSATFYVIPNLVTDIPDAVKYLVEKKQAVGTHIHPHNFKIDLEYPYHPDKDSDSITAYSFSEKMSWMKEGKGKIESLAGHHIVLYRSGRLSCDNETEKAARLAGFRAISNHKGIYYVKPLNIWNLGVGREDLLDFHRFNELSKYIEHFKEVGRRQQIVVFSAHPMLLYDHTNHRVKGKQLSGFFEFVDYLKHDTNITIINQYQLLEMVEKLRHK